MLTMKQIGVLSVALGLALGLCGTASAGPFSDYNSFSQVNPVGGSSVSDGGPGFSSSSVILDANNYAKSFATPGTSIMGAAVSADPSVSRNPQTNTSHDDSWWFNCNTQHICGSLPIGNPIP